MSGIAAELEAELEQELFSGPQGEHEFETAFEQEFEQEQELASPGAQRSEAFFNHLAAMADRSGRSQALRRIALAAARKALQSSSRPYPAVEGEFELELENGESALEMELAMAVKSAPQTEFELMLEHIGHAAAEAETEQEAAEQFLPLIPLAAKFLLPMAAKALPLVAKAAPRILAKVAPHLTRGVSQVARTLFRSPATRPLLRTIPRIARRTVADVLRQTARGQPLTPQSAARALARQTARMIGNPRNAVAAYRRSRNLDRRFHQRARRIIGRPSTGVAAPLGVPGPETSSGAQASGSATAGQAVCPTCGR